MVVYIANAFSLSMIQNLPAKLEVEEVSEEYVKIIAKRAVSAIGHEATASIVSERLGVQVPVNRVQIKLNEGDCVYVFQLLQRLPEGKVLSKEEISSIPAKWVRVYVKDEVRE